ncbi:hypothetical protein G9A89_010068 [Geosiphon pyriformis]|nr:hypothetical protein G9A89_010068 [Geosiphon pyriformis]
MDPVSTSADGSGAGLAEVEIWSSGKKKLKPKMLVVGNVVNLSAGSLSLVDIGDTGVNSVSNSVSSFLDVKNMENTKDLHVNIHTGQPAKALVLPVPKFVGSNWLLSAKSCVLEKHSFEPVKLSAASTLSKFSGIIRSFFTSELSLKKAKELAIHKKIVVNNNVKQINKCMNWKVIIKEIPSVFMGKNSVCMAKAINNKQLWVFRDLHQALFYTLPIGTMAYDLSDLLKSYGGKTCFISHNLSSYMHDRCMIVCFVDETSKLAAIGSIPVFKSVVTPQDQVCLANIYKKKQVPIVCPVFFGEKTWAQIAGSFFFCVVLLDFFDTGLFLGVKLVSLVSNFLGDFCLVDQLASLECSLELLTDQVLFIMKKLSFVKLVPLAFKSYVSFLVVFVSVTSNLDLEMALNDTLASPLPSLLIVVVDSVADLSLSSSKVLTTKMGGLESKIVALEVSVEFVLEKLDHFCSGLAKTVNESSFVVLGGDFNENGSQRCASFKKCLDFGLVNSLGRSSYVKMPT